MDLGVLGEDNNSNHFVKLIYIAPNSAYDVAIKYMNKKSLRGKVHMYSKTKGKREALIYKSL